MRELGTANFSDAIAAGPILVDFWAPWCRPCRAVEPILAALEAESGGRLAFAKLNVDEHPEIASRYDVLSIPRVLLFAEGELRGTVVGARPRAYFDRWLAEVLPADQLDGIAVQRDEQA
jgi:thioredoxin 1